MAQTYYITKDGQLYEFTVPDFDYHMHAKSGVIVESTVPFPEPSWEDNPWLHAFWSYGSWGSMILECHGYPGLRVFLGKRGWWPVPSEKKQALARSLRGRFSQHLREAVFTSKVES